LGEHEPSEGEVVISGEGVGEPFVVSCESAEACGPGEASFDHPSSWQQDEAAFGLGVFDHLQLNAVLGRGIGCGLAGVSLIDIGQFQAAVGDLLELGNIGKKSQEISCSESSLRAFTMPGVLRWLRHSSTDSRTPKRHRRSQRVRSRECVSIPKSRPLCRKSESTLSYAKPQKLTEELATDAQLLITMGCGDKCSYVPGLRRDDWPLQDPKGLSIAEVRAIREEVRRRVQNLVNDEKVRQD
jgi:hypothetical protein